MDPLRPRLLPQPMPKPKLVDEEYGTAACQNIQICDCETGQVSRVGPWAPDPPDYINETNTMNANERVQNKQIPLIKAYRKRLGKT